MWCRGRTSSIAKGDLTVRIDADYEGTFGELKDNSNETASQLGQIVSQIREAGKSQRSKGWVYG